METPKQLIGQPLVSHTEPHPFGEDERATADLLKEIYVAVIKAGLHSGERSGKGEDGFEWSIMEERMLSAYQDVRTLYNQLGIAIPEMGDSDEDE